MTDINKMDKLVFGHDSVLHPITRRFLEQGQGALSVKEQARLHVRDIARERGAAAAEGVRQALDAFEAMGGDVKLPTAPDGGGTLTPDELNSMKLEIAEGRLPPDAIKKHFEAEDRNVYGHDAKRRRDGSYIEQGVGSAGNQSRNSIEAYKKYGSAEPDFERNLARMEKELAASEQRRAAERAATA